MDEQKIVESIETAEVLYWESGGWEKCPFRISPKKFVRFAREDLQHSTEGGNLNAYHNAKRAIDCTTNWIMDNYSLQYKGKPVGAKFSQLENIGAQPQRILQKLIRKRNLLEHEFETISREDAEDCVDIAELYILSAIKFTGQTYDNWWFWNSEFKIGGRLEPISDTNSENPRRTVQYKIDYYISTRKDKLDPNEVLHSKIFSRNLPGLTETDKENLKIYSEPKNTSEQNNEIAVILGMGNRVDVFIDVKTQPSLFNRITKVMLSNVSEIDEE